MTDAVDQAVQRFKTGYNCCQSVLLPLADRYGLDADLAVRLATGFGIGMARGGTCGAVSGAVMVLGLAHGGGGTDGTAAKIATYARARYFYSRFAERHGTIICRDLLGLDPSTPDGLARARQENRFVSVCVALVADAVELVQAVLDEAAVSPRPEAGADG